LNYYKNDGGIKKMVGKEKPMNNPDYLFYFCECGKETNYGIFRHKDDNQYHIESCCGGGCVAVENIKYCPFCGEKIEIKR